MHAQAQNSYKPAKDHLSNQKLNQRLKWLELPKIPHTKRSLVLSLLSLIACLRDFLEPNNTFHTSICNSHSQDFRLNIKHALRLFRSTAPYSAMYRFRVVIQSCYSLLHIVSLARLWNHTRFPCSVSFARFACLVCLIVAVWQPLVCCDLVMRSDAYVPIWIIQLRTCLRTEFWSEKDHFRL